MQMRPLSVGLFYKRALHIPCIFREMNHISAKEPCISAKDRFFCKSALLLYGSFTKEPYMQAKQPNIRKQNSPTSAKELCISARDRFFCKGALLLYGSFTKEPYMKCKQNSPIYPQKCPVRPPKFFIYLQKSPAFPQKYPPKSGLSRAFFV